MELSEAIFASFGRPAPVATPPSAIRPTYAPPTKQCKATRPPDMKPAVVFHPEALTVQECEIDIANPQQAGRWFPTSHGTLVSHRFIASCDALEAIEDCIAQIETLRAEAARKESFLIGKMFALAEASRPGLVNAHTAPVAVTRSLELATIGMELSYEDPTLVSTESLSNGGIK